MNLELKHLAPYLPYGLKIKTRHEASELVRAWNEGITLYVNMKEGASFYNDIYPDEFKPILRPLSDLTKTINWEGRSYCLLDTWFDIDNAARHDWEVFGKIPDYWNIVMDNIKKNGLKRIDYGFVKLLFEHHYDVFGLIDNDLAIDINTI